MKVSVIIPAYNAMRYLPETLESVLNQTFKDFEVIVVNDGSSDETEQWVGRVSDSRVRLISQANQGASKARNTGIANARGEYIAFLDADDLWAPTKLEKQVALLDSHEKAGLVYTWVESIDQNGVSRGRILQPSAEGQIWETLLLHNVVECGSTPLVRRSCFDRVGLFDERLTNVEDRDMWLQIAAHHYDFLVVKEPLVYYRQHPNSKGKNWPLVERSACLLLEKAFADPPSDLDPARLERLRQQSYSMVYLRLAWKPLKSKVRDYKTALQFRKKALEYWPGISRYQDFIRLTIAIRLIAWLGNDNYDRAMSLLYLVRRNLLGSST